MPARSASSLRRLALAGSLASALVLGCLTACDRAHGSSPAATLLPPPAWLTGAWAGTFEGTGDPVRALILPTGACRLLNETGLGQVAGTLAVGGQSLSGSGSFFLPGALHVPSIGASAPFRLEGSAVQTAAPTVQMVLVNPSHGWDTTTVDLAPDPEAGAVPRLAAMAGSYTCIQTSAGVTAGLDLRPDGSFTGKDERGTFSGTLAQPNPAANALTVTLSYTLGANRTALAFTGLAYVRAGNLVVMTDAGMDQYSGVFAPGPAPL